MKVVDRDTLKEMIENNEDISNVDTSEITDMSGIFSFSSITSLPENFNTSNVTDMSHMFSIVRSRNYQLILIRIK